MLCFQNLVCVLHFGFKCSVAIWDWAAISSSAVQPVDNVAMSHRQGKSDLGMFLPCWITTDWLCLSQLPAGWPRLHIVRFWVLVTTSSTCPCKLRGASGALLCILHKPSPNICSLSLLNPFQESLFEYAFHFQLGPFLTHLFYWHFSKRFKGYVPESITDGQF